VPFISNSLVGAVLWFDDGSYIFLQLPEILSPQVLDADAFSHFHNPLVTLESEDLDVHDVANDSMDLCPKSIDLAIHCNVVLCSNALLVSGPLAIAVPTILYLLLVYIMLPYLLLMHFLLLHFLLWILHLFLLMIQLLVLMMSMFLMRYYQNLCFLRWTKRNWIMLIEEVVGPSNTKRFGLRMHLMNGENSKVIA
jgi:hypothetical protein